MKNIKKLLTAGVCVITAMVCTISAGAAEVTPKETGKYSSFRQTGSSVRVDNNNVYLDSFNYTVNFDITKLIRFCNVENSSDYQEFSFMYGGPRYLDGNKTYEVIKSMEFDGGGTSGNANIRNFNGTGGTYEKVRIKLSDFESYFNSDGSHTQDGFAYHFGGPEKLGKTTYYSYLLIFSGAAYTNVTPDSNGEAEFYVSTKIGVPTYFSTEFDSRTATSSHSPGGISYQKMVICKGNAKTDNNDVAIDDATHIQLYIAYLLNEEFTDLQKFNADVNNDGVIDIKDATNIQLYLADLL